MNRTTEKIPTWSLCYLINGDATALTDEEIRMVDEWVRRWQVEIEAAEKKPDVGRRNRCKYLRISLKISNFTSNSNTL